MFYSLKESDQVQVQNHLGKDCAVVGVRRTCLSGSYCRKKTTEAQQWNVLRRQLLKQLKAIRTGAITKSDGGSEE